MPAEGTVPLAALLDESWVLREPDSGTRRVFESFLTQNKISPSTIKVLMELSSTEAIKSAVTAGVGLGVMSNLAVINEVKRQEVKVVSLHEGSISRSFRMLRNKGKFQTKAVERFCSFFLEQIQD